MFEHEMKRNHDDSQDCDRCLAAGWIEKKSHGFLCIWRGVSANDGRRPLTLGLFRLLTLLACHSNNALSYAIVGLFTRMGSLEPRMTLSATLPIRSRDRPPRPWVSMAIMSIGGLALSRIVTLGCSCTATRVCTVAPSVRHRTVSPTLSR